MNKVLIFFIVLALSGCSSNKEIPLVVRSGEVVQIPVRVKCLKREEVPLVPIFPLDSVSLQEGENKESRIILAAREERYIRKEYVKLTQELLKSCSE